MTRHVIRLIHSLFLPAAQACTEGAWCPAVDVYRTRDGWLVKFELAGVRPEDIDLEVQGRRIRLRGTRRDCLAREVCHYYRMEIAYSHFERTLELPVRLDDAAIDTSYRDGMLLVTIRPTEAPQ
jgi:HSP20 family protein